MTTRETMPAALAIVLGAMVACTSEDPGTTETTETSTSTSTTSTTSGGPTTTTSSSTSSTTDGSSSTDATTAPAVCGDGIVDDGEECDDGNDDDNDACLAGCVAARCGDGVLQKGVEQCDDGNEIDGDACLNACTKAICGDGVVQVGVEECDDGEDNAFGVYDGCTPFCSPGPHCGDGKVDAQEQCDDGNNGDVADGCLDGCVAAVSCKTIKEGKPDAENGVYIILPEAADIPVTAWCDMETDGGGYSFLKVDVAKGPNSPPLSASLAEAECQKYGLKLLTPRTPAHAESAYYVAVTKNVPPVGGGSITSDPSYMSILSIYPVVPGVSCVGKALNSVDCPAWKAGDDGPFWVTDKVVDGQPSTSNCSGCSMYYEWNDDATVKMYLALGQGGFSSPRFLCEAGDKWE